MWNRIYQCHHQYASETMCTSLILSWFQANLILAHLLLLYLHLYLLMIARTIRTMIEYLAFAIEVILDPFNYFIHPLIFFLIIWFSISVRHISIHFRFNSPLSLHYWWFYRIRQILELLFCCSTNQRISFTVFYYPSLDFKYFNNLWLNL